MTPESRQDWLRRGRLLAILTVAYNFLEGVIAIIAGADSGSVALTGFGVDSFVEVSSAVIVAWRLNDELRSGVVDSERIEKVERRAARSAGVLLMLLAVYLAWEAVRSLAGSGRVPETSGVGIALTALSACLMPLLARAKLSAAAALNSRALRADAIETVACVWLSVTTLVGLGLRGALDVWWIDPVAALVLVPLIAREGWEAISGDDCCGEDSPGS